MIFGQYAGVTDYFNVFEQEVWDRLPFETAAWIQGTDWSDPSRDFTELKSARLASFRLVVDIEQPADGIIVEAGGITQSVGVAVDGSSIYFRAGDSDDDTSTERTAMITADLSGRETKPLVIEASANSYTNSAALYLNGQKAGLDSFTNDLLAKKGVGGVEGTHDTTGPYPTLPSSYEPVNGIDVKLCHVFRDVPMLEVKQNEQG